MVNPRRACTARVTVLGQCMCVRLSVTAFMPPQATRRLRPRAIPTASVLCMHGYKNTLFKSYSVKHKRQSQYANEFELTADSYRALPRSTKHGNHFKDN